MLNLTLPFHHWYRQLTCISDIFCVTEKQLLNNQVHLNFYFVSRQLLYQDDEPQIMYSYFLPKNILSTQKKHRLQPAEPAPVGSRGVHVQQPTQPTPSGPTYAWKLTGFSQCSHSCAGGIFFPYDQLYCGPIVRNRISANSWSLHRALIPAVCSTESTDWINC